MRKFTFLWCLLLCFATAMNAQDLPDKTSVNDLLSRYSQLGTQTGSVSDHFTKEEQRVLRAYFEKQQPAKATGDAKSLNTSNPEARDIGYSASDLAAYKLRTAPVLKNSSEEARQIVASPGNKMPLLIEPQALTAADKQELNEAAQRSSNNVPVYRSNTPQNQVMADITPVAGDTETFTPNVGDHFFDPGGPGGANTDGEAGNYPNCGCDTQSTLSGVSEIEFLEFGVNGYFDNLQIYDGTDASGTLLYDNSDGGLNDGDKELADMIASNGSASFTSTSGDFFFFFHSSSVVNWLGWDVEIIDAAGGGGGGGPFPDPYCAVDFPTVEPITFVEVAGVSNRTSEVIDGSPAHEDYTSIEGDMEEGESYDIALEGNTNGGFTCSFTVFIDWDQDGVMDNDSERYEIGTIVGSDGTDGQQATNTITVPAGVADGPTRMRVMKIFGSSYVDDSCTGTSWGQAEDYTINVTAGGGGGTGGPCSQEHTVAGDADGGSGSSVDSDFASAADIVVAAGEDFTIDTIEVPFLTFAPEDAPTTAEVAYYEDDAGLPGAEIGSETLVPTILSSEEWVNPVAYIFETQLDLTPFTFTGDATNDTKYWVSVRMGTATNQATVFWTYSDGGGLEGEPMAQFSAVDGVWTVPEPTREVVYNFSGECAPMGGGGPGPLTTVYGINNANQDLIGFGTATPGDTEVFGTSPITTNFENAGAIDPANPTTGYVLDNTGELYSFDVTTGVYTSLGNIPGNWVGLEYDRASGILYGIADTDLYTIDVGAVSATLVGSLGLATGALPIALAIDDAGVGYTYDLVDANLYSIDLATGATTLVGPIGFDANFGQGMLYDPTTDMVYMSAFNGGTFTAEWRSVDTTTGSTTLIGAIVTDDPDPQVAWASVGETLPPPACPKPVNLAVTNVEPTSADLSWDEEPNASSGYIWYVFDTGADPVTDTPVATGTTPSGTTTATATGLSGGSMYDFYVVADCNADGLSNYAGPIVFTTPPACGGKFYDNGGPNGEYENNSDDTTVITPENSGEVVTVTFLSFDVEATWDALYVYDGPDATYPIIDSGNPATNSGFPAGGYYGTDIPGPFTSTDPSGALTFVFRSEGSFTYDGWEADVVCAIPPPPNDEIANSIDVDEIGFPYTDPAVAMAAATTEDGNPTGCNIDGANGVWYNFVPAGDGTATATIETPAGSSIVTFYEAADENASETDLTLVNQSTNQCLPGTSTTINTTAGQAYYVFVVNSGGDTDITIDGTNLGIADNTLEGFSYYPNPADDVLTLRAMDTIENVAIYSILGQKVIDQSIDSVTAEFNISSLSTGTYIMKVSVNGEIGTYKVIKR